MNNSFFSLKSFLKAVFGRYHGLFPVVTGTVSTKFDIICVILCLDFSLQATSPVASLFVALQNNVTVNGNFYFVINCLSFVNPFPHNDPGKQAF